MLKRRCLHEAIPAGRPVRRNCTFEMAEGVNDAPQTAEQRKRLEALRLQRAQWARDQVKK